MVIGPPLRGITEAGLGIVSNGPPLLTTTEAGLED